LTAVATAASGEEAGIASASATAAARLSGVVPSSAPTRLHSLRVAEEQAAKGSGRAAGRLHVNHTGKGPEHGKMAFNNTKGLATATPEEYMTNVAGGRQLLDSTRKRMSCTVFRAAAHMGICWKHSPASEARISCTFGSSAARCIGVTPAGPPASTAQLHHARRGAQLD
jgi:hypothetical protein